MEHCGTATINASTPLARATIAWRGRIGIIIPQLDHLTEPLFPRYLPDGITCHVSRMARTGPIDADNMKAMNTHFMTALDLLPLQYLDVIVYHCTMGGIFYGTKALLADINQRTGLPAVTTMDASVEALRHVGATKVALVTPYQKAFNDLQAQFLRDEGFEVPVVGGEEFVDSGMAQHLGPEEVALWVRRSRHEKCDAVFVSCTGIRSLEFIEQLESDLGKPVITSTSATIWQILMRMGLCQPLAGLGRLLSEHAFSATPANGC